MSRELLQAVARIEKKLDQILLGKVECEHSWGLDPPTSVKPGYTGICLKCGKKTMEEVQTMSLGKVYNDPRAGHSVRDMPWGCCVKFSYKGYEVSLSSDGSDTAVYSDSGEGRQLFSTFGTDIEAVCLCKSWVDEAVSKLSS